MDASVTHLLRTVLAKSAKDQTLNPSPLKLPEDTSKVKKHIALLCDKLSKGARLVDGLPVNTGGGYCAVCISGRWLKIMHRSMAGHNPYNISLFSSFK